MATFYLRLDSPREQIATMARNIDELRAQDKISLAEYIERRDAMHVMKAQYATECFGMSIIKCRDFCQRVYEIHSEHGHDKSKAIEIANEEFAPLHMTEESYDELLDMFTPPEPRPKRGRK